MQFGGDTFAFVILCIEQTTGELHARKVGGLFRFQQGLLYTMLFFTQQIDAVGQGEGQQQRSHGRTQCQCLLGPERRLQQ